MTFANVTSVSGTGTISNVVSDFDDTTRVSAGSSITYGAGFTAVTTSNAGDITGTATFNLTGANAGTAASTRSYTGFGPSSSTTTLSGASGFNDTARPSGGMTFTNVTSVSGTGTISNVVSDFNDTTRVSLGSAITYGAGFTALTTSNAGDITGTTTFNLTGANAGTAASGDSYTGFGSSSSTTTLSGASGFDQAAKTSSGMTFASATSVTGTGGITNMGATAFDVTGTTQGTSAGISHSGHDVRERDERVGHGDDQQRGERLRRHDAGLGGQQHHLRCGLHGGDDEQRGRHYGHGDVQSDRRQCRHGGQHTQLYRVWLLEQHDHP